MIKRYVIHILAITAIKEDTFDLPPENNAMIICTNRSNPYRLCKEYKLLVSKIGVKARNYINNVAWRRAQRGKPNKHERWEILF